MQCYLTKLIPDPDRPGYPDDYLVARLCGRRGHLIADWKKLLFAPASMQSEKIPPSPDSGHKALVQEYRWVFVRMDTGLREIFRPFFFYTELRTIFICLRQLKNENRRAGVLDDILSASLLSDEVKEAFSRAADLAAAAKKLENLLVALAPEFGGVSNTLDESGTRGIESEISRKCLSCFARAKLHPVIKAFFRRVIDSRNVISLYKRIRLDEEKAPDLLGGGNLDARKLDEAARAKGLSIPDAFFAKMTGTAAQSAAPSVIENELYRAMTKFLKGVARESPQVGMILGYLWRKSLESLNLDLIAWGGGRGPEAMLSELIT